jgi:hypothetical protein
VCVRCGAVGGAPAQAVDLPRVISRNTGINLLESALCAGRWNASCNAFETAMAYGVKRYPYSTLVQAAEVLEGGQMVLAAADTLRINSGACGAI